MSIKKRTISTGAIPFYYKGLLPHFLNLSTSAFAFGVAIEFIAISIITFLAIVYRSYSVWFIVFMGFYLHLIVHFIQWILFRRYVPVIITSLIAGIFSSLILKEFLLLVQIPVKEMIISAVIGLVGIGLFLPLIHVLIKFFNNWIIKSIVLK